MKNLENGNNKKWRQKLRIITDKIESLTTSLLYVRLTMHYNDDYTFLSPMLTFNGDHQDFWYVETCSIESAVIPFSSEDKFTHRSLENEV